MDVGAVYDQLERELAGWRRRFADRPRREMIFLFLLALEREEIVAVGYREEIIAGRLDATPIAPALRELIRHALIWAWKDEEMHAVYIRGAILRIGDRWLKARAFFHQAAGAIAGWAGSVRQHVGRGQAPLSRTLAAAIVRAGMLTGKVPRDIA